MGGLGLFHGGLTAFHGVDQIAADLFQIFSGQIAFQQVDLGMIDQRTLHTGHQLDALGAGVGTLIELTGQSLHSQSGVQGTGLREGLIIGHVNLRLGEHSTLGGSVDFGIDVFHIITVQDTDTLQGLNTQEAAQVTEQIIGFGRKARALLHKNTIYHMDQFSFPAASAR